MGNYSAEVKAMVNHLGAMESMMEEASETGDINQLVLEAYLDSIAVSLNCLVMLAATSEGVSKEVGEALYEIQGQRWNRITKLLKSRRAKLEQGG